MAAPTAFRQKNASSVRQSTRWWVLILFHIGAVALARRPQWRQRIGTRIAPRRSLLGLEGGAESLHEENQCNETLTNSTTLSSENETQPVLQRRRKWFRQASETNGTQQQLQKRRRWFNLFDVPNEDNKKTLDTQQNATLVLPKSINSTATSTNSSSLGISPVSSVPATNRGGALVKERPAVARQNSILPSAKKLVERVKNVQNIWWVNAWSEQLPTPSDEAEMARIQNEIVARRAEQQRQLRELQQNSTEAQTNRSVATNWTQSDTSIAHSTNSSAEAQEKVQDTTIATKDEPSPKANYFSKSKRRRDESVAAKRDESVADKSKPTSNEIHRATKKHKRKQHFTVPLPSDITAVAPKGAYLSSGYWRAIDQVFSLGLAKTQPAWRLSSKLRPLRKAAARATGLHGVLSGKPVRSKHTQQQRQRARLKLAAIDRAKHNLDELSNNITKKKDSFKLPVFRVRRKRKRSDYRFVLKDSTEQKQREDWRDKRMKEIGKEMHEAQQRLAKLACEKDVLQERHNPLWKYTVPDESTWARSSMIHPEREFVFPSEELVDEYLDMLFATGRLVKLNHTDLWRSGNRESSDDDDELSGPAPKGSNAGNSSKRASTAEAPIAGNWLLRNGLGEMIGEKAELAAYKAVCKAIMEILSKGLSSLHGLTVMDHSDIRIRTEETPQLPPMARHIPGSKNYRDYAEIAINNAIRNRPRRHISKRDNDFIQKAAIVETLTSQCQLAAPIMNLFPLTWQRAIISNIISLVTAVIADFCEGIEFQILGHKLSISFTPITQEEMLQRLYAHGSSPRRKDTEGFEEAVRATAQTLSENLKLLDRWHQRALGSGVLVMQISTLIARLVLYLVDDILSASRMDLWSAHTGGPRLLAGFEYRTLKPSQKAAEGSSR